MYRCKICGKIFPTKKEAKKHVRIEHKKEWKTSGSFGTWINRPGLSSFIEQYREEDLPKHNEKKSLLRRIFSIFKK